MPFGLTSGPYLCIKMLRPLVRYIRENGSRLVIFLDDGWGVNSNYELTLKDATFVKSVLLDAGFLINEKKSILKPTQVLEWLVLFGI